MTIPQESRRRIVVTGLGLFSPIGIGAEAFWSSLAAGRSGIAKITLLDFCAAPRNVAGEVREFNESTAKKVYLQQQKKSIKVMCREIQLGVASALQAVQHCGLDLEKVDHQRFGVDFGANLMFSPPDVLKDPCWVCVDDGDPARKFHYERWGNAGENAAGRTGMGVMEPLWLLKYLPNMPGCHIGIALSAYGPNNSLTLEEASGLLAVSEAFRIMERGSADVMVAGATGTRLHPVKSVHAKMWDQLADSDEPPETWYRPFDARRTGQVIAEGSGALVLEEEAAATARGATIYGQVLGAGASCVIDRGGNAHPRAALANAMRSALRDAGLGPADVGHINAHGLGTTDSDREEAAAIRDVFGEFGSRVPVTAIKSYLGNSGAGCGVLELSASLLGLRHGIVPPTLNYRQPDPECPLNVVHDEPLPVENKTVLSTNVTRMGQAVAVIVRGM
jgi:3-oxoacyl-[acyl-carrier-protein] synthase II